MKPYHLYEVNLGYSSRSLVKITKPHDLIFLVQHSPVASFIGRLIFLHRLINAILKKKLVSYALTEKIYNSSDSFILIPWSQSNDEKFTLITDNMFSKHSLSERADRILLNEYDGAKKFSDLLALNKLRVTVPNLKKSKQGIVLEYPLLKAKRCKSNVKLGIKNTCVVNFFESSYYKNTKVYLDTFLKPNYPIIYNELLALLDELVSYNVGVAPMHGDFTNSNLIRVNDQMHIIDFEEFLEEGINIDEDFFNFRFIFDRKKVFQIKDKTDILCVYHYLYFQSKQQSYFSIDNIILDNNIIKLKL